MINPVVSIIVPFYNPKNYFDELLESISNQSYQYIEVVLVDDGSDNIYNEVARQFVSLGDNRILLTKENGGVASARQAGLEASTGELVIYADSDDLLPKTAIERMVETMITVNADIVVGGYVVKYTKKEYYVGVNKEDSFKDFIEGLFSGKYHGALWNKLMRRELYESVTFEPGLNYMEDKLMLAKIFSSGPYVISYLDEAVYVYRQNNNSITYSLSLDAIESSTLVVNRIADLYRGVLDEQLLNVMIKRQRAFEIYQSAKKGLNVFSVEDAGLIKDQSVSLKFRLALWFVSKDLICVVKLMSQGWDYIARFKHGLHGA